MLMMDGIGQVVATPPCIANASTYKGVNINVASLDQTKICGIIEGIQSVLQLTIMPKLQVYRPDSDYNGQSHDYETIVRGALSEMRRLHCNIGQEDNAIDPSSAIDDILRIYVSIVSGIMEEKIEMNDHKETFLTKNGKVWVERCYIICEIYYNTRLKTLEGFSRGVTVPYDYVEESKEKNWEVTINQIIAEKHEDQDVSDWRKVLTGTSQQDIIKEATQKLFENTLLDF